MKLEKAKEISNALDKASKIVIDNQMDFEPEKWPDKWPYIRHIAPRQ